MDEIKQCPFCGSNDVYFQDYPGFNVLYHFVSCRKCGTDGPYAVLKSKAISLWNSALRLSDLPASGVVGDKIEVIASLVKDAVVSVLTEAALRNKIEGEN